MGPPEAERSPAEGSVPDDGAGSGTSGTTVTDMGAWRERRAWARAVLWLHDHGLPAAVPYDTGGWLRAHGIHADWYHRAPCHPCPGCGGDGCWVLAADGDRPPPEIHCCPGTGVR
jgi:hypothetical protein